ncbi:MAG: hypothetical protein B5M53_02420 [Candidatus Cloacimonas sp. 4484_209]|nr:MAG: hypothetical protein B5M53_02420 [Candidatus Cloacimonas sp. 4484_209]
MKSRIFDFQRVRNKIEIWCKGRNWYLRAVLLIFLIYVGCRHLFNPFYTSIFGGLNLAIHELGHLVFRFAGEFIMVAGGTILQLAVPLVSAVMFVFQQDYFAVTVCGVWLSTNLYSVAAYVGDARAQVLYLVTVGGGEPIHDWHYLLSHLHILSWDTSIATFIRLMAFISMWGSIVVGVWMLWIMARYSFAGKRGYIRYL